VTGQQTMTHGWEDDHTCFIMNYRINLLLNSITLGLLTIKPITISVINIVSHLLTSLDTANSNQFAVNRNTQSIFVLSYPVLNVPNTFTMVLLKHRAEASCWAGVAGRW
jgi:hypothetical protein